MSTPAIHILDTTLRDGSYAIDFQFTAQDTALIAAALEASGIEWVEVGHGLGLGTARAGKETALVSDEAYLCATAAALSSAKFGVFCIPGIAALEDIDLAAECGAHFIRIGTDVDAIQAGLPFIQYAKSKGLIVFSNLMKSYLVTPALFAQQAQLIAEAGADCVYLVDSAGGMFPDEVATYLDVARQACSIPFGFHGHNNLSMAVANSLQAVESGAHFVDASLQGLGRSAGNAVTEILASVLQQKGHCLNLNMDRLLEAGQGLIRHRLDQPGINAVDITAGRAKIHSAQLPLIKCIAQVHDVSMHDLILRLGETAQSQPSEDIIEKIARELAQGNKP